MNSDLVKPEKFDHLYLDYHFTVTLTALILCRHVENLPLLPR